MGKQHNRRIFAVFYKRYDNKYIYVVTVVTDIDTGEQVVIFHEGIDAYDAKYYCMTKKSFCEMVEVDGEWVDKYVRQTHIRISEAHIANLEDSGFKGPVRKKKVTNLVTKTKALIHWQKTRHRADPCEL